tara:strand:- start:98 stop:1123 length:1026 start_codon:yes stop_codon:yes gene_type:complete
MPQPANSLFDEIEGLRSEDLVTETLAFILRAPEFEPLQKLFYEYLLKDKQWQGTLGRKLDVRTQVRIGESIPDMELKSDDTFIVVENKFTAEFSGDNQLARYHEILLDADYAKKHLVLLCPRYAWKRYENQTLSQFEHLPRSLRSFDDLTECLREQEDSVHFTAIVWDELLELLHSDSPLISSFSSFVRKRFLVPVHFTEKQRALLMNHEIPETLTRIIDTVKTVRSHLDPKDIETGRFGQAVWHYGFFVKRAGFEFWFGYLLTAWQKHKTPFFVQCRKQWGEHNHELTDEVLEAAGFKQDESSEFVLPLEFDSASEKIAGELAVGVMEALDKVLPGNSAV